MSSELCIAATKGSSVFDRLGADNPDRSTGDSGVSVQVGSSTGDSGVSVQVGSSTAASLCFTLYAGRDIISMCL